MSNKIVFFIEHKEHIGSWITKGGMGELTSDPNKAISFEDKHDAELYLDPNDDVNIDFSGRNTHVNLSASDIRMLRFGEISISDLVITPRICK